MSSLRQYFTESVAKAPAVAPTLATAFPPRTRGAHHARAAAGAALAAGMAAAVAFGLVVVTANAQGIAPAVAQVGPMPHGWYAVGAGTGDYAVGTDRSRRDGGQGQGGGTIRSLRHDPAASATLQQSVRADRFRGDRVRLSGFVKTGAVASGAVAGLWMRVDGPSGSESNDYMQERRIEQGTDWARYDVVLDVPRNAVGLSFGVLLTGQGQVWLDDVALERVSDAVALTGRQGHVGAVATTASARRAEADRRRDQRLAYVGAPLNPVNLSFTDGTRKR